MSVIDFYSVSKQKSLLGQVSFYLGAQRASQALPIITSRISAEAAMTIKKNGEQLEEDAILHLLLILLNHSFWNLEAISRAAHSF